VQGYCCTTRTTSCARPSGFSAGAQTGPSRSMPRSAAATASDRVTWSTIAAAAHRRPLAACSRTAWRARRA
jgi:hypothetical protein